MTQIVRKNGTHNYCYFVNGHFSEDRIKREKHPNFVKIDETNIAQK